MEPNADGFRKRQKAYETWLRERGAEILPVTNEWELSRFRVAGVLGVVYTDKHKNLTLTGIAIPSFKAYRLGQSWSIGVATPRRQHKNTDINALLKRDGPDCFYCRRALGNDITVEHLVARAHGGPHHLSNLVLAHKICNAAVDHMAVIDKIKYREQLEKENAAGH